MWFGTQWGCAFAPLLRCSARPSRSGPWELVPSGALRGHPACVSAPLPPPQRGRRLGRSGMGSVKLGLQVVLAWVPSLPPGVREGFGGYGDRPREGCVALRTLRGGGAGCGAEVRAVNGEAGTPAPVPSLLQQCPAPSQWGPPLCTVTVVGCHRRWGCLRRGGGACPSGCP